MTIAVCYVSPEGVVFGADSTSTWTPSANHALHFFNHGQKIFEIGDGSTLALVTWGLGGLATGSHRFEAALLSDSLVANPPASVEDVARRFIDQFWPKYQSCFGALAQRHADLSTKPPPGDPSPAARSQAEDAELKEILQRALSLKVGFCVGGYLLSDRVPTAYEIQFDILGTKPLPRSLGSHAAMFWGVPNMIHRLTFGIDTQLFDQIARSSKWTGTDQDLLDIVRPFRLPTAPLPVRDAVDYVYTCIHSTIRALKFSTIPQVCGGPVEVAVVTVDRKFRWVKHKPLSSAIHDGDV